MSEAEKTMFVLAVGLAAFIIGYHVGSKNKAATAAEPGAAAAPVDAMDWLTMSGRVWR